MVTGKQSSGLYLHSQAVLIWFFPPWGVGSERAAGWESGPQPRSTRHRSKLANSKSKLASSKSCALDVSLRRWALVHCIHRPTQRLRGLFLLFVTFCSQRPIDLMSSNYRAVRMWEEVAQSEHPLTFRMSVE